MKKTASAVLLVALITFSVFAFAESGGSYIDNLQIDFQKVYAYYGDDISEDIYIFFKSGIEYAVLPTVINQISLNPTYADFHIDQALKDLFEVIDSESVMYKQSGEYHFGIIKNLIEHDFHDGNDYNHDTLWISSLLNEYRQKNAVVANDRIDNTASSSADSTNYEKEILFRDIPWGISLVQFEERIGFNTSVSRNTDLVYWSSFKPTSDIKRSKYSVGFNASSSYSDPIQVAGYNARLTFACFLYGKNGDSVDKSPESSEFYLAAYTFDVEDSEGTYLDLKEKMNSLYGNGTDDYNSNEYNYSTTWYGANDTAVRLRFRYTSLGGVVYLVYGKLDSDQRVTDVDEIIRNELVAEEQANRNDSIDGL